ncbi:amino acid deaminase [Vibrio sp.]|nr:amino acid deaminase [Vibrio sp.]
MNKYTYDVSNKQDVEFITNLRGEKGLPITAATSYSLTKEDVTFPAAVIKKSALENNMLWMQNFADSQNVKLCPHGKTTMTPAFFEQQKQTGAWGITVATIIQAEVAAKAGISNIIMANQLVGKTNIAMAERLMTEYDCTFYCCVDSLGNVDKLNRHFANTDKKLNVLLEMGVQGGRCGCRTESEAMSLAQHINESEGLTLAGLEFYEGVIHGGDEEAQVRAFLHSTINLTKTLISDKLLPENPIVTGAGSAWYDIVAELLGKEDAFNAVIRPGCYVIHDTGIYLDAQNKVMTRLNQNKVCDINGDLSSSLEVWTTIISKPESTKAVALMGKRDVAFDEGLPTPERAFRDGVNIDCPPMISTAVMDQHTFIELPDNNDLQTGDIVVFSTSHPCITFDKWKYIGIVDDNDNIIQWVTTAF